jgi:hypothetical protein
MEWLYSSRGSSFHKGESVAALSLSDGTGDFAGLSRKCNHVSVIGRQALSDARWCQKSQPRKEAVDEVRNSFRTETSLVPANRQNVE